MIYLNHVYFTKKKEKNKHLTKEMYDKIESEYNHFIFSKTKSCSKTFFMQKLASLIATSISNLYEIIRDGMITTLDYDLSERNEFSATVAWNKRTKKSIESNSSKRKSSIPFINLILKEFRNPYNINSIDEIIGDFKKNRQDEIQGMVTICTATFYNYVELNKIENFSSDELPMKCKRKRKKRKVSGQDKT